MLLHRALGPIVEQWRGQLVTNGVLNKAIRENLIKLIVIPLGSPRF